MESIQSKIGMFIVKTARLIELKNKNASMLTNTAIINLENAIKELSAENQKSLNEIQNNSQVQSDFKQARANHN